jgi:hypothetical protein
MAYIVSKGVFNLMSALIFSGAICSAQSDQNSVAIKSGRLKPSTAQKAASIKGALRMEGMQYLTTLKETPSLTNSQYLSAQLEMDSAFETLPWLHYQGDFSAGTFFKRSQTQLVVREMNLSFMPEKSVEITLGRKKKMWSQMDSFWQLGLWQPKYAIDTLRPEQQGLTGLFIDRNEENFGFLFFASPIFIPTMGPEIREESGSLRSDSRWYKQPISEISFGQRVNSFVYKLDIPEVAKLAVNPSLGLSLRFGQQENGLSSRVSYARKPVNDLILKRKNFKAATQDRLDVTVQPDINFHHIYSADLGYENAFIKGSVSYVADQPFEKRPDKDQIQQKLYALQATSAQAELFLEQALNWPVRLQAGWFKLQGGKLEDIADDGSPDDFQLFDRRMNFSNSLMFGIEGEMTRFAAKPLLGRLKYLYDQDQKGSLLSTEVSFFANANMAFLVGADFLGVDDENRDPNGFLNQFRANDRIYGGLTYVF